MRKFNDLQDLLEQLFDEQELYNQQREDDYWSHVDDVYHKVKNMEDE